jgi:hypothetical protein
VIFSDERIDPEWKVVCPIDVHSRRSAVQFAIDESDILGIGRDADFEGLMQEFGNNGAVPE